MKATESLKVGLAELLSNKMRAALTMLGIMFGVAAVIAMMSIGEGAKQETLQQIKLLGTNNIIIQRQETYQEMLSPKTMFSPGLNIEDGKSIKKLVPYINYVTPERYMESTVEYKSHIMNVRLVGTTPRYPETFNYKLKLGTFFKNFHLTEFANVCIIGADVKQRLFKFQDPLNKKIKIGDLWFNIIGAMAPKNVSSFSTKFGLRDFNQYIYIPITTMAYKMGAQFKKQSNMEFSHPGMQGTTNITGRNSVDQLTVKINKSDNLKITAYLVKKILARLHYGIKDYSIILPEELLTQKQKTERIFDVVMGAIAGISLLVGGIGIMNIMLANILERTKEIGVRRAVGATKIEILRQFIFEALTISIIGGLLGIVLGLIFTSLITTYASWKTFISTFSIIIAFIVSVATGLIFGIYPAKKAADKNPVDCLRYE